MQIRHLVLSRTSPQVMGILNVTPDSFSDGGRHNSIDNALTQALAMESEGATIIDIGGESTRPGAPEVTIDEELRRVVPVVEAIRKHSDVIISIDTSKPEIMDAALHAGADFINDVRALQLPGALDVVAKHGVPVCLMHMQGDPASMQNKPVYSDVTAEVEAFLISRINACIDAGIDKNKILLDPGFGFGKTLEHNYALLADLPLFHRFGMPLLIGMSRKSMIGQVINKPVDQRLAGSLALATIAAQMGAHILRVHDVAQTRDVIAIVNAFNKYKKQ
ncbi:dihydropteroate synthase [Aestuariibacter sp. GS-14]|uniref:dihydropteroate synthase n=1 Tax=Aestuariibacter sp. GS-14 TaxID=2590670 RepID=UPI0015E86887|nr:dihydropteroate synthase [Aestuariibacter sp. GS-14]